MSLNTQQKFFYKQAGYSYNAAAGETPKRGHERCARALARAERWAVSNGYTFTIEPDSDADESWMDDETDEYKAEWAGKAWCCQMIDADGRVVQSLCGCYGDETYMRVVKAELALEEMCSTRFAEVQP